MEAKAEVSQAKVGHNQKDTEEHQRKEDRLRYETVQKTNHH